MLYHQPAENSWTSLLLPEQFEGVLGLLLALAEVDTGSVLQPVMGAV